MKELIATTALIATLFAGTHLLWKIHDCVRKAALEKAAQGLPSLVKMNKALRHRQHSK